MFDKVRFLYKSTKQLLTQFPSYYSEQSLALARINGAFAKASVTSALRTLDETLPMTWEFSGFSQNGEDGIIDFLSRKIKTPNFYFIEIGAADGIENNTTWLALARKFNGVMIEGNSVTSLKSKRVLTQFNGGVKFVCCFVTPNNILPVMQEHALHKDPDVFSLDVDGTDYYLAQALLAGGMRPKIFVVEYNSVFGPEACLTVPYYEHMDYLSSHHTGLYFGVSISAWKKSFKRYGYEFVTVDRNGVNAFFIDTNAFEYSFVKGIKGVLFQENFCQLKRFGITWQAQFDLIRHLPFENV